MIQLRAEQIQCFAEAQAAGFLARLEAFLRAQFPDTVSVSQPEMHSTLESVVQRASAYGLEGEQEQAVFAVAAWLMGENFAVEHSRVHAALSSSQYSSAEKSSWLDRYVHEMFDRLRQV
jgi:hypothetical protein